MGGLRTTSYKESLMPPSWERPSGRRRVLSALVDLVVWVAVVYLVWFVTSELAASASFGRLIGFGGSYPPDEEVLYYGGFSFLCANLYLGISNGAGRSVGKALTGLRLVVFVGPYPARPGFARGLVRSALQNPVIGAVMVATGAHNAFSGTTIARVADHTASEGWWGGRSLSSSKWDPAYASLPSPPRIAAWKIAVAVLLHLFFATVFVLIGVS